MPTDALFRPTALHQFAQSSEYDERMAPSARSRWSPSSSDSGDDESNDATDDGDELNKAPGPAASAPAAPARPALQLRNTSPPRSSPLSPLAGSRPSAGAARVRLSPLAPMGSSAAAAPSCPRPQLNMPKGQSLSRSLLNRAVSGASQPQKPKKTTKLIVPSKPMRTTFELGLCADELRRK